MADKFIDIYWHPAVATGQKGYYYCFNNNSFVYSYIINLYNNYFFNQIDGCTLWLSLYNYI